MDASALRCGFALLVLSLAIGADAYMYHAQRECRYSSKSLDGLEFIERHIFNKLEYLRYNSTLNQFIGYTELGVKNAERLNKDPAQRGRLLPNRDTSCKPNAGLYYKTILDKTAEPYIRLRSEKPFSPKHPAMLVCSVFGFYPKLIKVTWLRNGQTVGSDVTSTEELSDGDWYYQIHSHLEYTPESGETISCKVEHGSFPQPREVKWDPSMPGSDRNKVIIGASGLVLGLVIAAAGGVYYKKKSTGRILVPTA